MASIAQFWNINFTFGSFWVHTITLHFQHWQKRWLWLCTFALPLFPSLEQCQNKYFSCKPKCITVVLPSPKIVLLAGRSSLCVTFAQHCEFEMASYTKDLTSICSDLANVMIIDNSPSVYKGNPGQYSAMNIVERTCLLSLQVHITTLISYIPSMLVFRGCKVEDTCTVYRQLIWLLIGLIFPSAATQQKYE